MKKTIFLSTFLVTLGLLVGFSSADFSGGRQINRSSDCTPDTTGGGTCPTETPNEPTRTPTVTATNFPIAVPSATTTPYPLKGPDDGLVDPPRPTPGLGLAYPTSTNTPFPFATAVAPQYDLQIWAMEVTQGMQNLDNDMPLVEDRLTVVRVYVRSDVGSIAGVRGFLTAYRGNNQLGIISSENQPITADTSGGERVELDDSLYFYIPESWIKEGAIKFKAVVYANTFASIAFELNPDNNYFEADVKITQPTQMLLTMITIHNHDYDDFSLDPYDTNNYYYSGYGADADIVNAVYRLAPVSLLGVSSPPTVLYRGKHDFLGNNGHTGDFNFTKGAGIIAANSRLTYLKNLANLVGSQWYGMLDEDTPICAKADSCGTTGVSNYSTAFGLMRNNFDPTTPWSHGGGNTMLHELGHNMGLKHYDCSGTEKDGGALDDNAPFTSKNCSLAPIDPTGYYGFDVYWSYFTNAPGPTVISNNPTVTAPNLGFPLMGYKGPPYADPYTYCYMLNALGVSCNPSEPWSALPADNSVASVRKRANTQPAQQADSEYIFLTGFVDTFEDTADFYDIIRIPEATENMLTTQAENEAALALATENGTLSGYELVFASADGETLASTALFDQSSPHEPTDSFGFVIATTYPAGTSTIYITNPDGDIIAARTVSAPPTVSIVTPLEDGATLPLEIRWQASDPDGDELTFNLFYSPDNGENWTVVAMGLAADAVLIESFDGLPGSDSGIFRVMAMDGINTTTADMTATIVVPDSAPTLTFSSPSVNRVYPLNATVIFAGGATDLEDGVLGSDTLSWTSDIDGDLGTGSSIMRRDLSAGLHAITLTATDSAGNTAEITSYITIDDNVVLDRPSEEEFALAADAFNGILPEGDAPPSGDANPEADTDSTAQPAAPAGNASGVALLIGGGLLALVLVGLFLRGRRNE